MKNLTKMHRRKGLTLLELLLVLVVLIATSGILVAVFPNIVGLAHASSSASNIESVVRQLENHRAMFGGYPDSLDMLIDDTDALAPFGGTTAATELAVSSTTGNERWLDALEEAGITGVIEHPSTLGDEETATTFGGTAVDVDAGAVTPDNLVTLGADAIARLGLDPATDYLVLGLGSHNEGIGRSMASAPIHFLPGGESNEDVYSRFLLIFRVPEEGAAQLATVATVDVHDGDGEVLGLDGHIAEYYHSRE